MSVSRLRKFSAIISSISCLPLSLQKDTFTYFTHTLKSIKGPQVKNPGLKVKAVLLNLFSYHDIHRNDIVQHTGIN